MTKFKNETLQKVYDSLEESEFKGHMEVELVKAAQTDEELEEMFTEYFGEVTMSSVDYSHLCKNLLVIGLEIGHRTAMQAFENEMAKTLTGEEVHETKQSNIIL